MDSKLKAILSLALHPSTGEGEAAAALNRARAMVSKNGFEELFKGQSDPPKEKIVYRDRVMYRDPNHTHSVKLSMKVRPKWQHSLLERLFKDCHHFGCTVEMIRCKGQTQLADSGLDMEVRIHGTPSTIKNFEAEIHKWFEQMNGGAGQATSSTRAEPQAKSQTRPNPQPQTKGQSTPRASTIDEKSKPWWKFW